MGYLCQTLATSHHCNWSGSIATKHSMQVSQPLQILRPKSRYKGRQAPQITAVSFTLSTSLAPTMHCNTFPMVTIQELLLILRCPNKALIQIDPPDSLNPTMHCNTFPMVTIQELLLILRCPNK